MGGGREPGQSCGADRVHECWETDVDEPERFAVTCANRALTFGLYSVNRFCMRSQRLPGFVRENYEIHEWRHALAILHSDFPDELGGLVDVLTRFRLNKSWIKVAGGHKSKVAEWIDGELRRHGWRPREFDTKITVDERSLESPTHEVDCFKNGVALSGRTR